MFVSWNRYFFFHIQYPPGAMDFGPNIVYFFWIAYSLLTLTNSSPFSNVSLSFPFLFSVSPSETHKPHFSNVSFPFPHQSLTNPPFLQCFLPPSPLGVPLPHSTPCDLLIFPSPWTSSTPSPTHCHRQPHPPQRPTALSSQERGHPIPVNGGAMRLVALLGGVIAKKESLELSEAQLCCDAICGRSIFSASS